LYVLQNIKDFMTFMYNLEMCDERDKESMGLYGVKEVLSDKTMNKTMQTKFNLTQQSENVKGDANKFNM